MEGRVVERRRHVSSSGGACRRVEGACFAERRGVSSSGRGRFRREKGRVIEWRGAGHVFVRGGAYPSLFCTCAPRVKIIGQEFVIKEIL